MLRWLVLLVLGSALACEERSDPPPNLLLVSLDTTRRDHCSLYGYSRNTTPHLVSLAERGATFNAAYSPTSSTGPTHASLFTSLYPDQHGVRKNGDHLSREFLTLAERLREAGYETAGFVSSFVLDEKFGFAQGFDHYSDEFERSTARIQQRSWAGNPVEKGFDRPGDLVREDFLCWLDERDATVPFFAFVHFFDAHDPFTPREPFAQQFDDIPKPTPLQRDIANYDSGIAFADAQLGEIFRYLDQNGLEDRTLVIVFGDHGEGLMQHGIMHHGRQIYEEQVRVPFVWRWPGVIHEGLSFLAPIELLDLLPTLDSLLGLDADDASFEGIDLAAALRGERSYEKSDRSIHLFRRHYSGREGRDVAGVLYGLRRGNWKFIEGEAESRRELYRLDVDPRETDNLVGEAPERAAVMATAIDRWLERSGEFESEPPELSDEDRAALEALGYVD